MDTLQRRKLEKQRKLEEQKVQEQQSTYQAVLEYLLKEGFASTEKSADNIILNMSESWFQNIISEEGEVVSEAPYGVSPNKDPMVPKSHNERMREVGDRVKKQGVFLPPYIGPEPKRVKAKPTTQMAGYQPEGKLVDEEASDAMKDRRMERGGVGGNQRYNKPVSNTPNTFGKKKPKYDGMSAVEKVKAAIEKQYGKGAIMDTKKKKK